MKKEVKNAQRVKDTIKGINYMKIKKEKLPTYQVMIPEIDSMKEWSMQRVSQ